LQLLVYPFHPGVKSPIVSLPVVHRPTPCLPSVCNASCAPRRKPCHATAASVPSAFRGFRRSACAWRLLR
jgi:hypothetical protein